MIRGSALALVFLLLPAPAALARDSCGLRKTLRLLTQGYKVRAPGEDLGLEIEGIIYKSMSHEDVALEIARELNRTIDSADAVVSKALYGPDYIVTYKDPEFPGEDRMWIVKPDDSIKAPLGSHGVELNTPVLHSQRDRDLVHRVIHRLRGLGLRPEPGTAGIHVHVGVKGAHAKELALLKRTLAEAEGAVMKAFGVTPGRAEHTKRTPQRIKDLIDRMADKLSFVSDLLYEYAGGDSKARHQAMNLLSFELFETAEFRFFNSTLDPASLNFMMDFSQKYVAAIRTKNPQLLKYIVDTPAEHIRFDKLAEILGLKTPYGYEINEFMHKIRTDTFEAMKLNGTIPKGSEETGGAALSLLTPALLGAYAAAAASAEQNGQ